MIILGLGSNMGDRMAHLRSAWDALASLLSRMQASHVLESKAVLPPNAPPEWDVPYLNMAVCGECDLRPEELLARLKNIERKLGREPRASWAPRQIDIDILAVDNLVMSSHLLTIPHPQLLMRDFALIPLAELAPHWRYPVPGSYHYCTATEMIKRMGYTFGDSLREMGKLIDAA